MDNSTETTLDGKISAIENHMSSNVGKGQPDAVKDRLYKEAQELWSDYTNSLKGAQYNFYLNRPQYKFLTNLLLTKLEYDVNTVFFAIELTEMLGEMRDVKYTDDTQIIPIQVDTTEITYIYHLISKHKVSGLTKDAYLFAQILRKIGEISKIFNYYDASSKALSTDVQDWVAAFEDGISHEGSVEVNGNQMEAVEAIVSKPAKSKEKKKKV
jgi:hypothetical protein